MGRNFCHRPQPGPWTLGWEESRDWLTPLNAADPFLKTRLAGLSCQPPGQPDSYFGALPGNGFDLDFPPMITDDLVDFGQAHTLSLIHISEPTRLGMISYAVFCLK